MQCKVKASDMYASRNIDVNWPHNPLKNITVGWTLNAKPRIRVIITQKLTEGCAVGPGVVNIPKNTCFHDV